MIRTAAGPERLIPPIWLVNCNKSEKKPFSYKFHHQMDVRHAPRGRSSTGGKSVIYTSPHDKFHPHDSWWNNHYIKSLCFQLKGLEIPIQFGGGRDQENGSVGQDCVSRRGTLRLKSGSPHRGGTFNNLGQLRKRGLKKTSAPKHCSALPLLSGQQPQQTCVILTENVGLYLACVLPWRWW